jgi:hypothetical protein
VKLSDNVAVMAAIDDIIPASGGALLHKSYWEGVTAVDQAILKLLDHAEAFSPEEVRQIIGIVVDRRAALSDQIELERLVRRPRRDGHIPLFADDDLIESYERTLALLDKILAVLGSKSS